MADVVAVAGLESADAVVVMRAAAVVVVVAVVVAAGARWSVRAAVTLATVTATLRAATVTDAGVVAVAIAKLSKPDADVDAEGGVQLNADESIKVEARVVGVGKVNVAAVVIVGCCFTGVVNADDAALACRQSAWSLLPYEMLDRTLLPRLSLSQSLPMQMPTTMPPPPPVTPPNLFSSLCICALPETCAFASRAVD